MPNRHLHHPMETTQLPATLRVTEGCVYIPDRLSFACDTDDQLVSYLSDLQYLLSSMTTDDHFVKEDQGFFIYSERPTYLRWANKKYLLDEYHTIKSTIYKTFGKEIKNPDRLEELADWATDNYNVENLSDGVFLTKREP